MNDDNALFVFECLLRDNTFMSSIDEYIITTIFVTKTFDVKHVPQLVLILMTLLSKGTNYIDIGKKIKNDSELQHLLEIFYNYITDRIKENLYLLEFNITDFKKSYDICVRLAILKLKFTGKTGLCCIRGQAPTTPN